MRNPERGEVWLINFEPQTGSEILKTRPGVVINHSGLRRLPVRIVVPIRNWQPHHIAFFFIRLEPTPDNGLSKTSNVDCSQVKSFDLQRFTKRLGVVTDDELNEIVNAVALAIGA
ncbi:MAG: type II toxin-antitoxin system PemK/MazF family toxin [Armatimonadetes bacterium]|nr:type II toxin-antitoxin system PemK/MazF family toxin [Armatimonadota bacterium]